LPPAQTNRVLDVGKDQNDHARTSGLLIFNQEKTCLLKFFEKIFFYLQATTQLTEN
jgi:hypothetical protein